MKTIYTCLQNSFFQDAEGYCLVPIRHEDMESIRLWRNAQIEILRQETPITANEQEIYYQQVLRPLFTEKQPPQILFSYLYKDSCIGYGGLTHIQWMAKRAEVSFLTPLERAQIPQIFKSDFIHFLSLLCQAAFQDLKFHRLFTEAYAFRKDLHQILEEFGFKKEGVLRDHVFKNGQWHDSIIHGLLANK